MYTKHTISKPLKAKPAIVINNMTTQIELEGATPITIKLIELITLARRSPAFLPRQLAIYGKQKPARKVPINSC